MDLKEKVADALRESLKLERLQLEEDDGIYGFVVSTQFQRMPALDRQHLIHKALRGPAAKLSKAELRQILTIAALTPVEYESLGYEGKGKRR